jgi:HD-GYP domain-containing protein (c-di-GMP phosphodiesterase class II)
MSETQVLLSKITALRQKLEQVRGLAQDAGSAATALAKQNKEVPERTLRRRAALASEQAALLDSALRQLNPDATAVEMKVLPTQLTARARRLLERGGELLSQLRTLVDELDRPAPGEEEHPIASRYRETAAMTNAAMRMIQAFPDAPRAQLRLCDGLESILNTVAERIAGMMSVVDRRRERLREVERLAELLSGLFQGQCTDLPTFVPLAEQLFAEAQQAAPLRFLSGPTEHPALFIACHSLTVAQVMARLVRQDPQLRAEPIKPVLAALLHDLGMLAVPAEILAHKGSLDDGQRRVVERHTRTGAELIQRVLPGGTWLMEAISGHHERLDGTGYPAGLREGQLASLTRLLAVCDVYAALCSPRPQRRALDTRTALTDTLLLAEQGVLDRYHAERLLQLSFYPIGTVVELADGAVGVVVATHTSRRDLTTPARPVVALVTDTQGRVSPVPQHVDLAECETRSIVRTLPLSERRALLGKHYPELVSGEW